MRSYGGNDVVANWCEVVERPDVTYDQLVAMVGTLVASRSRVERDLPRLNAEIGPGRSTRPSAKVARWYWTDLRKINEAADRTRCVCGDLLPPLTDSEEPRLPR